MFAMQPAWVILVSLLYAGLLFAVAWLGDRHAAFTQHRPVRPAVYSLALAVYCSSWTFYGAAGTAAMYGLGYLPIYLGPMLMMLLGWRLLERLATVARAQKTVSIADFIASRFGRSQRLAALVTVVALVAAVPYLALQYKAVASSLAVLAGMESTPARFADPAFYIAAIMALFAILFGTRRADASEHRPGLMLAVALESVVKLLALVAVGVFAVLFFQDRPHNAVQAVAQLLENTTPVGFVTQTLLSFAAIICLPRQFHIAIVECGDLADIRRARWWFSAYLLIISLMVLPIAAAGLAQFGMSSQIAPDAFVLALPMALGHDTLALAAYIGGFSAATGMVIMVSVALSNMVSNDWVMPLLLRRHWQRANSGGTPHDAAMAHTARQVLWVRRITIVLLALLAYAYSLGMDQRMQLASFGLMAFAAVAQFAPALVCGLYWPGASRRGVELGLLAGFAVWLYTLLLPSLAESGWLPAGWLASGPFGIAWLRPYQLFGTVGWDALTHGVFWSLLANLATLVLVSLRWPPGLSEQMQAQPFLSPYAARGAGADSADILSQRGRIRVADLQMVAGHVVGAHTAASAFAAQAQRQGVPLTADSVADRGWLRFTERLLAGAVGAASARMVMTRALQGSGLELAAVVALLDEAGPEMRFNRDILLATLENIDPGVSVVDAEMRLVAWNRRYEQLFNYPPGMLYVGCNVAELIAYNLQCNPLGLAKPTPAPQEIATQVDKRIALMRSGRSYTYVRALNDGRHIEMRGNPLPNGGYVTAYSDITAFKNAERELREINETLEQRVAERTREAEQAHATRSRYLTAISHDVLQPIHAARLFATALQDEQNPAQMRHLAERVDTALTAAEELLDGVLDISRLDAGALQPQWQRVNVALLLQALFDQYAPLAAKRHIAWQLRCSTQRERLWVRSDPRMLRRIVQNFIANALRYTQRGRILMTARPAGGGVRIQVWDTGPGIPQVHLARIYDEFHRYHQVFDWDGRGLGLGLSICQRISRLLEHPLEVRSRTDHGSMFGVWVPRAPSTDAPEPSPAPGVRQAAAAGTDLAGMCVLCLDNDPDILQGMAALLARWGIAMRSALTLQQALQILQQGWRPDCLLIDYHLYDQLDGLQALARLRQLAPGAPAALITANGSDALQREAAQHQCSVLTKPVRPAALRAWLMAQRRACRR